MTNKIVTVNGRKIDERVLDAALKTAGGSVSRLDWDNVTVKNGVIVAIGIANRPKSK